MKKSLISFIVAVFLLINFSNSKYNQIEENEIIENINEISEISYTYLLKNDPILKAIAFVESRYDTEAFNKNDKGTGLLQITPIMVQDINRINELRGDSTVYTLEDRLDPYKSIEMYYIFNDYYNHSHPEEIARAWNSGPKWYDKTHKTDGYWEKIQERLDIAP
jgi:hypothetical protein